LQGNSSTELTAIEGKISEKIRKDDLNGLVAVASENPGTKLLFVCQEPFQRTISIPIKNGLQVVVHVYPWKDFLSGLWSGKL
jgi:hypothetical protein